MRRPALLLLAVALPSLWAAGVRSEPPPPKLAFRLDYRPGVAGCPPASSLDAFTGQKFGYGLFADDAQASLSVTIRREATLEAVLVARDAKGATQWETVLASDYKCADLIKDVALQLFITFGPSDDPPPAWALAEPPPAPPAEPPPAPAPPVAGPPVPAPPTPSVHPPRSTASPPSPPAWLVLHPELSAAFVFAPLDTPGAAFGGALQAAVRWSFGASLGLELRGVVDHQDGITKDSVRVPVRPFLVTGAVIPCLLIQRFRTCGVAAFGTYNGPPSSTYGTEDAAGRFGGVGLRLSYEYPVSKSLLLRGYGEALILTLGTRSRLASGPVAGDKRSLWEPPSILPSVGLALVWAR